LASMLAGMLDREFICVQYNTYQHGSVK
jgi:hypothetical protein